jgi:hypothetical protein
VSRRWLLLLALASGCAWIGADEVEAFYDRDGDGFRQDEDDCDDADPEVRPDATEACNGIDDDCDGDIDERGATGERAWFADVDEDGWGDEFDSVRACEQPDGFVDSSGDCDDDDPDRNPDAIEICDGIDNDCDRDIDADDGDVESCP